MEYLKPGTKKTFCEFKGQANSYDLVIGDKTIHEVAQEYSNPKEGFEKIKNYLAFYPSCVGACYVNDEKVTPQEGDFYGGWITKKVGWTIQGIVWN